ncbi:Csu type fimbrial protein [Arenimonas composti]|uniref:Spore coat protein U/FanG domain-containing protein n=1 Tax=Arenimonas composti TR7-09 = DSM 18010 TaxID=1121013 RepID=A0A091BG97_9GAMM|nr:spore coat U domain-containing protein [Arenimonas composti]KFN50542.1 hypothetical protein P873_06300 [Arenimonas composti TR7-09 = DSM 18010]
MKPLLRLFAVLALLAFAPLAAAQSCSIDTQSLQFGVQQGLPTGQIDMTTTIVVSCPRGIGAIITGYNVCVSIDAGSGSGSTVADRRMSLASPAGSFRYQLYTDGAHSQVFGNTAATGVNVTFPWLDGTPSRSIVVHGRVPANQNGQAVGTYTSQLTVTMYEQGALFGTPASCGNAPAATRTFQASLQLQPSCTITAQPLDFGVYSPTAARDGATNLSVTCTRNGAWSLALDGGSVAGDVNNRRMRLGAGPATINYQLYSNAARTSVWGAAAICPPGVSCLGTGAAQSVPVYGRVPAGQGAKASGTYVDTVTATVTY